MSDRPGFPADPPRRLGAAIWGATAPLLLWALHFFVLYVAVASGCTRGWAHARWAGLPAVNFGLGIFSAAALVLAVAIVWRSLRGSREKSAARHSLIPALRLAGGVLALVGIVWNTVPLLMITPCAMSYAGW